MIPTRLKTLFRIYKDIKVLLLNVVIAFLYYYLITSLIAAQNRGIILFTSIYVLYAIYTLAISASVLLTISIMGILKNRQRGYGAGVSATVGSIVGGLVVGCGCSYPLIISILGILMGSADATYLDVGLFANQLPILLILIAINFLLIFYYLGRIGIVKNKKRRITQR